MAHPPEPCPQCGLLMGHEIALLVGQHLTCPPITPDHERRAVAVSALLHLVRGELTGRQLRDIGTHAVSDQPAHPTPHIPRHLGEVNPPVPADRIDQFARVLDEL